MKKMTSKHIGAVLMSLWVIMAFSNFASAAAAEKETGKEQFGEIKGTQVPSEPAVAPVKENICRNPKLCESLEIDMLNNLQKARVAVYLPGLEATNSTKDYKVALNLGIAVTDALSCTINKNKTAFPKYAGMISDDAKKLGIPEAILSKYGEITELAQKGEWDKLGTSIYEFKDAITTELSTKNKQGLGTLAMVSGGLEGLYIVAKSVDNNFSPESAVLLRNVEFVKYLEMNIKSLSEELKATEEVKAIVAALPKIDKVINSKTYTKADVNELLKIFEPLRKSLVSG